MTSTGLAIQTRNLTKVYRTRKGGIPALRDLNLEVQQGEIFGYLGPNGAGKTTTIRLLLDLIRPTNGQALIFGKDATRHGVELRRRIGFLPGELSLWLHLTGQQVVNYAASAREDNGSMVKKAQEIADRLSLDLSKRVRALSSGNKRKLGLVVAMMHTPELLILDEPTSGLDPLLQQTFHQMMREARDSGRTVFLSSHVLAEVQAICDRVGILREGQLKAVERVSDLTRTNFQYVTMRFSEQVGAEVLAGISGVSDIVASDSALQFRLSGEWHPLLQAVRDRHVVDIRIKEPTLEDIFLTFYGGGATPQPAHQESGK